MEAVIAAGVEVIVLADHNDASWAETMIEAGSAAGVVVFPGVEITTGSGADGVHLILFGGADRTRDDFTALLSSVCGFGQDHPRFDPVSHVPASSPRTAIQILDDLPDGFLAFAPHAFNDNGVASPQSVKGDIRWKILHHDRLGAVDVGDLSTIADPSSWKYRFAHRTLEHFPCLTNLAFVSTSDAYELGRIGKRWTWIRMTNPTIEGLRQAFLDYEARIICDWDSRHSPGSDPNEVTHSWVEKITLQGLTTSRDPVEVDFHPCLNVLIGGRGSGKSTIVAGVRALYGGGTESLPTQARAEAAELMRSVFPVATITAHHHLAHSGDEHVAEWTAQGASNTRRLGEGAASVTPTDFKVRVINQKELFERAAHSSADAHSTSRNLLALVDDALALGSGRPGSAAAFDASLAEAQTAWISAARAHQAELETTGERDVVAARVRDMARQVAAFDSPENRSRRERNDSLRAERSALDLAVSEFDRLLSSIEEQLVASPSDDTAAVPTDDAVEHDRRRLVREFDEIRAAFRNGTAKEIQKTRRDLEQFIVSLSESDWGRATSDALADSERYRAELEELGVDPAEYERVRSQFAAQSALLENLDARLLRLPTLEQAAVDAWEEVVALLAHRRAAREGLLNEVAERSGMLRFTLLVAADIVEWVRRVRELLNLRADGFLADVPELGRWLWPSSTPEKDRRSALWRQACVTGDFTVLAQEAKMRPAWAERLAHLDPVVRARLGSTLPDDAVEMRFLIEGGNPSIETDWKALTAGSPGQRSAAMLSFVLHHGVEPLVLDQPEDDLDTEWITELVVRQLRTSRWVRQLIIVTHNANIPVNADAERVITMENHAGGIRVRRSTDESGIETEHAGGLEDARVREDVQKIMEGGVVAFVNRELRYNNELNSYRATLKALSEPETESSA